METITAPTIPARARLDGSERTRQRPERRPAAFLLSGAIATVIAGASLRACSWTVCIAKAPEPVGRSAGAT